MQNRAHGPPVAAYPLGQLGTAFALGILVALSTVRVPISLLVSTAASSTLLGLTALVRRRLRLATMLLTLAMFFAGALLASIEKDAPRNQLKTLIDEGAIAVGQPVELTGVLERDPEVAPERLYLFLRVQKFRLREIEKEASGEAVLLASVPGGSTEQEFGQLDLRYGARIRIMTMLERADHFRNPGVSSFTEYLDRKGYDATGFVKSPLLIERLENERVFLPLAWLYEWRRKLQREIDIRFSKETAGVLDAALLGNRYNLSRSTSERFREGGTFHVLVISGLHITFLGGLVFLLARRFTSNRLLQFLLSVAVLWGYALAVGAESSVLRAALMFTVVVLAPLVSRRASSLNALGGAVLALLVLHPGDLLDPSFQLTFVSVLAIVILAWPLMQKLSAVGSWRPTRETPYPPSCAPWLRNFCESFFWSEREGKRELERANYNYKLFKAPIAETLERLRLQRLLRYAFGAIVVSVSVQLALLPFLVVYFHRLSFASFVLNIGVSVMMAGVAIIAFAGLLIAQLNSALAAPIIRLADGLNWLMVHSVDPFARVGMASLRLPEYTGWSSVVYVLYFVPLAALAILLFNWRPLDLPESPNKPTRHAGIRVLRQIRTVRFFAHSLCSLRLDRNDMTAETAKNAKMIGKNAKVSKRRRNVVRLALFAQLSLIALVVLHPLSVARPSGKLRIDFLDVGQGDSALITMPDNTTLLIDGGGRPGPFEPRSSGEDGTGNFERESRSIGESVVSEYLWGRGLDRVDYILATHADADHIDGLNDVARNFSVRAALVARTPSQDPEFSRFSETLSSKGIPIRTIGAGDEMRFGNVSASVLWPLPSANSTAASRNNDSIVLRLQLGESTLLLTGDIEAPAEDAMLHARENLWADVVKVAHHGSKTSSTKNFISAVQPHFAVISVGQTSIFGHPNYEVVERWKHTGAQVLTTGENGTITVSTDGRDLKLQTFVKER